MNEQRLYFKITNAEVKGVEYFGIFVSSSDVFPCDHTTFQRGWEISKLTPEIKVEFEADLRNDAKNFIEV